MNPFFRFVNSSVGKKILMSLTGIFLSVFLVEHLAGNLLLLKSDGGQAFNDYAKFMGGNPIVRILEIGLLGLILLHIVNGIRLWLSNRTARGKGYGEYRLDENTTLQARMMKFSAALVLLFLVIHLQKFWVPARFLGEHDIASLIYYTFQQPFYVIFYLVSLIVVGYHLRHGFQSAFQTMGFRTKPYQALIEFVAVLFWLIVPVGFAIIPIYIYFFSGSPVAVVQ
ncbi:MAG: succinate dehydrogenase cytochrome b subunit [Bacteroidetes bacterium]|nr:succinate dehydrogenase cytochrome b subunit [Bacteroidota bacterium]